MDLILMTYVLKYAILLININKHRLIPIDYEFNSDFE